jgi:iron complex outermembrane receptor protein
MRFNSSPFNCGPNSALNRFLEFKNHNGDLSMKKTPRDRRVSLLSNFLIGAMAAGSAIGLQSAPAFGAEEMEEVMVSGLRGKPRTVTDSAVPVDVFNSAALDTVSYTDMNDILQTLVPSFNVSRQPISDGGTFIRPLSLRDLPSHHTLVLVNGKRRHRAALVSIGGSGTQGPDVATIPASAIQSIEVLRDGASAQYGSDAIAGVINFNLKNNTEGGSLTINGGQFGEGDGSDVTIQGNIGFPLGETGFLSISGEVANQDFTERSEQYCESWFCLDPNNPRFDPTAGYADFVLGRPNATDARLDGLQQAFPAGISSASIEGENVMPWGTPNSEAVRLFYNAGIDLTDSVELYSFGSYSASKADGGFFYRYPGNGTIEDLRLEDGSLYSPLEKFPGGFTPRFEGEVTDISIASGVKGVTESGLGWDVSLRYGSNEISYRLFNTINPSLGPDSPTDFRPGDLTNEELQFQADFYQDFDLGGVPAVLAFGVSYLDETYEITASSQVESYAPGPFAASDPFGFCNAGTATAAGTAVITAGSTLDCANSDDPAFTAVGVGSNGFPGFSPAFSEDYSRDSYAFYGDLSADVTEDLFLQAALRYEDYSDFGSEVVGKLATLYRFNDSFAIRGSVGTGFRAPTPGQQGTTNVSTRLPDGFPVATGLFPASGDVAAALGAAPLQPESSTNYTIGLTADFAEISLTLDFYRIDIDDRFYSITTRDVSTDPTSGAAFDNFTALDNAGVVGANTIGGVFYFTNAFDSSSQGVDLVATMPVEWGNNQSTQLTASMNYNKSSVESDASAFLGVEEVYDFENQAPNFRGIFTAAHNFNESFSMVARASYFGESDDSDDSGSTFTGFQTFDSVVFFDLEGTYQFTEVLSVTAGGRNLFDAYPDQIDRSVNDNDYCCGRLYSSGSFVPWQGSYYFMALNARF